MATEKEKRDYFAKLKKEWDEAYLKGVWCDFHKEYENLGTQVLRHGVSYNV